MEDLLSEVEVLQRGRPAFAEAQGVLVVRDGDALLCRQGRAAIAGDLVPLHTGTGPDFWLALRGYKDYPGLYTMVEIAREDWGLLPAVNDPWKVALVPKQAAEQLTRKGYIPGLINSNDAAAEVIPGSELVTALGFGSSREALGTTLTVEAKGLAPGTDRTFHFEERRLTLTVVGVWNPPSGRHGYARHDERRDVHADG